MQRRCLFAIQINCKLSGNLIEVAVPGRTNGSIPQMASEVERIISLICQSTYYEIECFTTARSRFIAFQIKS